MVQVEIDGKAIAIKQKAYWYIVMNLSEFVLKVTLFIAFGGSFDNGAM